MPRNGRSDGCRDRKFLPGGCFSARAGAGRAYPEVAGRRMRRPRMGQHAEHRLVHGCRQPGANQRLTEQGSAGTARFVAAGIEDFDGQYGRVGR